MVPRRESHINVNVTPQHDYGADTPEIRKYKKRFNSEILCAALWGVNLLIGTENGLMLLDRWTINSCLILFTLVETGCYKFMLSSIKIMNTLIQVRPGQGLSTYKPTKVPTNGGEVLVKNQQSCDEQCAGAGGAEHPCHDQREEEQSARLLPLLAQEQDTQVSLIHIFLISICQTFQTNVSGRRMR